MSSTEEISKLLESLSAGNAQGDYSDVCVKLVSYLADYHELEARVAEAFASLAREEGFRDVALKCGAVPRLTKLLTSTQADVQLQAMRALGNLCFDHDGNREEVLASGGCPCLVELLTRYEKSPPEGMEESKLQRLKSVTCGCLLNVACENDELCGALLDAGVVEALSLLLSPPGQSQAVLGLALQFLNILLDSESSDLTSLASTPLPSALVHLLHLSNTEHLSDTLESLMEALHTIMGDDKCKVCLVQAGLVDKLLEVTDEQFKHKAVDFITLLLAEDECLQILFKEGRVLEKALEWIGSDKSDLQLKASAALMIANMARSDANCSVLVSKGVLPLLIALTRIDEKEVADKVLYGKFHTAAFSALRNLSLPAAHKEVFLTEGVVDAAVHCLRTSSQASSWYKALGTLRLLIDKQAATCCYLTSQEGLVACVCELCASVGPVHIAFEGSRLLAALVKISGDKGVMREVVTGGGVKWISSLLEAEHSLLVNEALISLTILAAPQEDAVLSSLAEAGVVALLAKVLACSSHSAEILSNGLVLLHTLYSSDLGLVQSALEELHDAIAAALQTLSTHTSGDVKSKVQNLKERLHF